MQRKRTMSKTCETRNVCILHLPLAEPHAYNNLASSGRISSKSVTRLSTPSDLTRSDEQEGTCLISLDLRS